MMKEIFVCSVGTIIKKNAIIFTVKFCIWNNDSKGLLNMETFSEEDEKKKINDINVLMIV